MKKTFLVCAILFLFFTIKSNSQILLDENFNYAVGDSIEAHGWVSFSGGATNLLTVASGNLTFPNYVNSNIGNYTRVRNNGQDAYTSFTPDSTGSLYCSMLVSIDSVQTAGGDYFVGYLPSTSTTLYTDRLYAKDSSGSISFGISKSTVAGGIGWTGPNYQRGVTYLLVLKYTWLTGSNTDDLLSLYVFSGAIPVTEPAPTIGPITGTATDATNLGRIAIRQGSASTSPSLWIDGFRVSTIWNSLITGVTPVNNIAGSFSLKQNYPNPFNPNTNIEFTLANSSFVTLKVYDIMGREVSNLVKGDLRQGTYKVDFNALNMPSGAYFYKLNAVESISGKIYSETKSMMLVK